MSAPRSVSGVVEHRARRLCHDKFGSDIAFMGLAAIAALGLLLILLIMPETRRKA